MAQCENDFTQSNDALNSNCPNCSAALNKMIACVEKESGEQSSHLGKIFLLVDLYTLL